MGDQGEWDAKHDVIVLNILRRYNNDNHAIQLEYMRVWQANRYALYCTGRNARRGARLENSHIQTATAGRKSQGAMAC